MDTVFARDRPVSWRAKPGQVTVIPEVKERAACSVCSPASG